MAEFDIRFETKNTLFQLLVAEATGDYGTVTNNLIARMTPEDVKLVKEQFAEWKEGRNAKTPRVP